MPAEPKKAGRPKKPDKRLQGHFNDIPVENLELAELIDAVIENAAAATRYRQASTEIKKQINDNYSDYINIDADGIHSGWLNVLGRRIYVGRIDVPEKPIKPGVKSASRKWVGLDPHKLSLFDAVAEGS